MAKTPRSQLADKKCPKLSQSDHQDSNKICEGWKIGFTPLKEQYFWWMLWWRGDLLAGNQQFEVEILKVLNFQFIFRCKSVSIREMENKEPGKINLKSMKNILEMIFLIIQQWASEACSPPQSELIIFLVTPNCCLQTVLGGFYRREAPCRPI